MTITEMLKTETIPYIACFFTLNELEHILDSLTFDSGYVSAEMTTWPVPSVGHAITSDEWTDTHAVVIELITDKINHEYEMRAVRERETINEHSRREQELTTVFSTYHSSNYVSRYSA